MSLQHTYLKRSPDLAPVANARPERSALFERFRTFVAGLSEERRQRAERELASTWRICQEFMAKGDCEPYLFERVANMLRRARRYEDEIVLCTYVKDWAAWREQTFIFGAQKWLNYRYKRIIARKARAQALLDNTKDPGVAS